MPAQNNADSAADGLSLGSSNLEKITEDHGEEDRSPDHPTNSTSSNLNSESNGRGGFVPRLKQMLGINNGGLREDLQEALSGDGTDDEHFSADERMFLRNILALRDLRVEDVMVPRAEIDAAPIALTIAEILRQFEAVGHSRMPVFDETLDDPRGMIHIKGLMGYITKAANYEPKPEDKRRKKLPSNLDLKQVDLAQTLEESGLIRPLLFVPPSMKAPVLLAKMQVARIQMALVIDEYGGTDGLVSLEDLVETIVGDIEDEHDEEEEPDILAESQNSFVADATAELADVLAVVGADFEILTASEDYDTLGGLVFDLVGRVPIRGELIPAPGKFEFEILEADPRRIRKIRIHRRRRTRHGKTDVKAG